MAWVGVNVYQGSLTITNSTVSNMQSGSRPWGGYVGCSAGTENWYGHGVYSYGSALTATGNTFTGNATTAVYVNGGSSPTIANNTFTGNAGYAVNLKGPMLSLASGSNNASGNTINGIGLGGSTIGGNTPSSYTATRPTRGRSRLLKAPSSRSQQGKSSS
ncbi:MAG: right-handed parallel beta-helix repeat-containing protein [Anaerolineae bacterium]